MTSDATHWAGLRERGLGWGLNFSAYAYRLLGRTGCLIVLSPIILYFFLSGSEQRRASQSYLARVLPMSVVHRRASFLDSYRHFIAFAGSALDSFAAWSGRLSPEILTIADDTGLKDARGQARGALFIVSHLGNADVSRALLDDATRKRLTILVHTKHAVRFNEMLEQYNPEVAVNTVQVTDIGPETTINLQERIDCGEWVVIAGDRTPLENTERVISAPFLGETASFAQGPYILASVLKCPVYLLFCFRAKHGYELHVEKFSDRITLPRQSRDQASQTYAARYANRLEHHVIKHPFQWYNFFDFWA